MSDLARREDRPVATIAKVEALVAHGDLHAASDVVADLSLLPDYLRAHSAALDEINTAVRELVRSEALIGAAIANGEDAPRDFPRSRLKRWRAFARAQSAGLLDAGGKRWSLQRNPGVAARGSHMRTEGPF